MDIQIRGGNGILRVVSEKTISKILDVIGTAGRGLFDEEHPALTIYDLLMAGF